MPKIKTVILFPLLTIAACAPNKHSAVQVETALPGRPGIDAVLARDVQLNGTLPLVMNKMQKECPEKLERANPADEKLLDTEIIKGATQTANGTELTEIWTYRYCTDKTVKLQIVFLNKPSSGTTFAVQEIK